jgi:hypothetical protein
VRYALGVVRFPPALKPPRAKSLGLQKPNIYLSLESGPSLLNLPLIPDPAQIIHLKNLCMSETQEMPVDTSIRTIPTVGYAAYAASENLAPFKFDRREPLAHDVLVEILYCGVCHSDLHCIRNDWGISMFPLVANA